MLLDIVEGLGLGFMVAAVPGAILVETVRRTIFDKASVLSFTLGNFVGMALLILVSFLGITVITENASVGIFLSIVGGGVLVFLGAQSIVSKPKYHVEHVRVSKLKREYSSFTTGFILSLANPIRIAFWVSIIGTILYNHPTPYLAFSKTLSVFVGIGLFYVILICALARVGPRIKYGYLLLLSKVLGVVILAYGLNSLIRIILK